MKTMQWLIRREIWEHKGMLLWAPVALAGVIAALVASALVMGHNITFHADGDTVSLSEVLAHTSAGKQAFAGMASQLYLAAAAPLYAMLGFLVFFYCVGALHNDRTDRSILFWKSLPVSDTDTVLSKVLFALVVVPLAVVVIGAALSVVVLLFVCTALSHQGYDAFGAVLKSPEFYLAPLRLVGMLPVYALWALPTVGWLLMVSSWARSKVMLWAVGVPVLAAVLVGWMGKLFALPFNSTWLMENIVSRMLGSVAPGSWFVFTMDKAEHVQRQNHPALAEVFNASWQTVPSLEVLGGVAAGAAMIAVAVWLRRWRDEA